jgi:hypothetical protein
MRCCVHEWHADPSTVEANKPAIPWSPETVNIRGGNNCTFTVLGDNTWRVTAKEGCGSVIGLSAVAVLAAASAFVALKKKD